MSEMAVECATALMPDMSAKRLEGEIVNAWKLDSEAGNYDV